MTSRSISGTGGGSCEPGCNNVSIAIRTDQAGSIVQSSKMLSILNCRRALRFAAGITGQSGAGVGQHTVQLRNLIV